ncbi:MAG TPA: malonate transporter subunit MadL [Pirellulaceae bacterium]|nr:malonate transporter subunit MadL [Pirellulaceae bacterium]
MAIYGTALLSICLLVGLIIGKLIGMGMGIDANVGGVGIAMLLLIVASSRLQQSGHLSKPTQGGVLFWSSIYIPIVVAMAASQNVRGAITGGPAAILAGTLVVACCFALVPLISRIGRPEAKNTASAASASATHPDSSATGHEP